MKNILNKLFKTWIILVASISVVGFIVCASCVLHDSYVVSLELLKVKDFVPEINPYGDTSIELKKIPKSVNKIILHKTNIDYDSSYYSDDYSYSVHNLTWGDRDFSNFSYILIVSLWLVGGDIIILISLGLKLWLTWLIRSE